MLKFGRLHPNKTEDQLFVFSLDLLYMCMILKFGRLHPNKKEDQPIVFAIIIK